MSGEYDLHLVSRDLAFGQDDEPLFLAGTDVIAQDVKHRLEASGLPPELVGDDEAPAEALARIARVAEEDLRLRPGTARAAVTEPGQVALTAETMDGGTIAV